MDRRTFLAATAASAFWPTISDSASAIGESDLKFDIEIVRRALALHPGLHRYSTPQQIDARLAALEREYLGAPDRAARFLSLSKFLAAVRCGHTHCNPYNQSDEVVADLFDRRTRLPFRFAWIRGRMIVLSDESGLNQIPRGSEIIRINGAWAPDLLKAVFPYARADGGNDGKRVAQMEMRNTDAFEAFDIFQGLLEPPRGEANLVRFRRPDGARRDIDLPIFNLADRRARRTTPETDGAGDPLWSWEMRGDIALLTMPTWVMYNSKWDWRGWLDERLASLAGARGLVIDLRDNEGGNECGNVILARLAKSDLSFPGYEQRVRFRSTPPDLDPYLTTWDRSFRTIGENAEPIADGFLRLPGPEETDLITAEDPKIAVPVAALVGPACSSATFSFARRAKESKLVRLFGAETGGNLRGINGSAYFFVRLPASGLEFDVPLIGFFPVSKRPDKGVAPDVFIEPTADDISNGADPCLDAATSWIRRQ